MEQVLINGWFFNFKAMIAYRAKKWEHYDLRSSVHEIPFCISGGVIFRSPYGGGFIPDFFSHPEDIYDEEILRAHASYLFEKDVLLGS